jgi:hypothetical protein
MKKNNITKMDFSMLLKGVSPYLHYLCDKENNEFYRILSLDKHKLRWSVSHRLETTIAPEETMHITYVDLHGKMIQKDLPINKKSINIEKELEFEPLQNIYHFKMYEVVKRFALQEEILVGIDTTHTKGEEPSLHLSPLNFNYTTDTVKCIFWFKQENNGRNIIQYSYSTDEGKTWEVLDMKDIYQVKQKTFLQNVMLKKITSTFVLTEDARDAFQKRMHTFATVLHKMNSTPKQDPLLQFLVDFCFTSGLTSQSISQSTHTYLRDFESNVLLTDTARFTKFHYTISNPYSFLMALTGRYFAFSYQDSDGTKSIMVRDIVYLQQGSSISQSKLFFETFSALFEVSDDTTCRKWISDHIKSIEKANISKYSLQNYNRVSNPDAYQFFVQYVKYHFEWTDNIWSLPMWTDVWKLYQDHIFNVHSHVFEILDTSKDTEDAEINRVVIGFFIVVGFLYSMFLYDKTSSIRFDDEAKQAEILDKISGIKISNFLMDYLAHHQKKETVQKKIIAILKQWDPSMDHPQPGSLLDSNDEKLFRKAVYVPSTFLAADLIDKNILEKEPAFMKSFSIVELSKFKDDTSITILVKIKFTFKGKEYYLLKTENAPGIIEQMTINKTSWGSFFTKLKERYFTNNIFSSLVGTGTVAAGVAGAATQLVGITGAVSTVFNPWVAIPAGCLFLLSKPSQTTGEAILNIPNVIQSKISALGSSVINTLDDVKIAGYKVMLAEYTRIQEKRERQRKSAIASSTVPEPELPPLPPTRFFIDNKLQKKPSFLDRTQQLKKERFSTFFMFFGSFDIYGDMFIQVSDIDYLLTSFDSVNIADMIQNIRRYSLKFMNKVFYEKPIPRTQVKYVIVKYNKEQRYFISFAEISSIQLFVSVASLYDLFILEEKMMVKTKTAMDEEEYALDYFFDISNFIENYILLHLPQTKQYWICGHVNNPKEIDNLRYDESEANYIKKYAYQFTINMKRELLALLHVKANTNVSATMKFLEIDTDYKIPSSTTTATPLLQHCLNDILSKPFHEISVLDEIESNSIKLRKKVKYWSFLQTYYPIYDPRIKFLMDSKNEMIFSLMETLGSCTKDVYQEFIAPRYQTKKKTKFLVPDNPLPGKREGLKTKIINIVKKTKRKEVSATKRTIKK